MWRGSEPAGKWSISYWATREAFFEIESFLSSNVKGPYFKGERGIIAYEAQVYADEGACVHTLV